MRTTFARRRSLAWSGASLAWGLVVVMARACLAPTQIAVEVLTDLSCSDFKGATLLATKPASTDSLEPAIEVTSCTPTPDGRGSRTGSLVFVPSGETREALAIRVVGARAGKVSACVPPMYGDDCIVARRKLRYVPQRPLKLPILLRDACAGVACSVDSTCIDGTCRPAEIEGPARCGEGDGCDERALASAPTEGSGGGGGAGGASPVDAHAACATKLGVPKVRFAFVTENTLRPELLGGIAGAAATCGGEASKRSLGEDYLPWLCDSNPANAPANTFTDGAPWVRVDCEPIALTKADWLDGTLAAPLDRTASGVRLEPPSNACSLLAFTNTNPDGTVFLDAMTQQPANVCGDWSKPGPEPAVLEFGSVGATDKIWSMNLACAAKGGVCSGTHAAHLYCFER
ncbi:MAG: hypothetical protein FJ096_14515 [Deltaproteobacteria bacterium]|nr:hypothetical protein [Deltaproteobacteria bacterium]